MPKTPPTPSLEPEWILREAGKEDGVESSVEPGPVPPESDAGEEAAPHRGDELAPLVRQLLRQRGFTDQGEIERFLFPRLQDLTDPFLLPDMEKAVARVLEAIDRREHVVLYGDYDVDGVTSLTLLARVLAAYGLENVTSFLPHRMDEGYGLSHGGLERCLASTDPQLLIAADCGTSSVDEAEWLRERGIDLIILDHHELSAPRRPECVALVNPKMGDDYHYLCTAGVVFKLAHAMLKRRQVKDFRLRDYIDLVAVGTVADIVPLVDENRLLVRRGLQQLERTPNAGLEALKVVAGVGARPQAGDIGFRLGPRLNAAGRLDTAQEALDLLLTDDASEARRIAKDLDNRNRERQAVEMQTVREVEVLLDEGGASSKKAIVLGSREWHPGVVGIVASRVTKRFHRPTFIVAFDEDGIGKGSGRSVRGVSLVQALDACRDLLIKGGGHDMAAGLTIEEEKFPAFQERLAEYMSQHVDDETLRRRVMLDAEVSLGELELGMLDSYELLQPFGTANPQPVFLCRGIQLASEPRVVKERHLKLALMQDGVFRDAIYFGGAEVDLPKPPWDLAVTIDRNVYRGRVSVSIMVQAVRAARGADGDSKHQAPISK